MKIWFNLRRGEAAVKVEAKEKQSWENEVLKKKRDASSFRRSSVAEVYTSMGKGTTEYGKGGKN